MPSAVSEGRDWGPLNPFVRPFDGLRANGLDGVTQRFPNAGCAASARYNARLIEATGDVQRGRDGKTMSRRWNGYWAALGSRTGGARRVERVGLRLRGRSAPAKARPVARLHGISGQLRRTTVGIRASHRARQRRGRRVRSAGGERDRRCAPRPQRRHRVGAAVAGGRGSARHRRAELERRFAACRRGADRARVCPDDQPVGDVAAAV